MAMKKLICTCCGAPINREKRKCEYCGTEYEFDTQDRPFIRIETFHNPVREFAACAVIPRQEAVRYGEEYMKYAINNLAQAMLPAVMEGMRIQVVSDPTVDGKKLVARMKVVIPEHVGDYEYKEMSR